MNRLMGILDGFWFTKAPATRLALLRILLGAYTLYYVGRRYSLFMRIAATDPTLFKPVGVASNLKQPIPVTVFRKILLATLLANVAFMLGWRHKYTGPLFASLLLWVLCYRNSWSMIYHSDNVIVLHAIILGLTPAADALSLDSFKRVMAEAPGDNASPPQSDWCYGWPIQLMNTVTVIIYFLSGVAKVMGPLGWKWATGESLRSQVAVDGLRKEMMGEGAASLAFTLYDKVSLFRILAIGSMFLELLAPAILLDKRVARLWAFGAFLLHWGIYFVMKITFRYQMSGLLFVSFFDIERIAIIFGKTGDR
jgi:hypothetical protein